MIIAIVGARSAVTEAVVSQLKQVSPYILAEFTMAEPEGGRMSTPEQRLEVLKQLRQPQGKSLMLAHHVHFEEEAEYIRQKKGFVFHVKGAMSEHIPMKAKDMLVTAKLMAEGAYYPVADALHECRLKHHSKNNLPEPSVRWLK